MVALDSEPHEASRSLLQRGALRVRDQPDGTVPPRRQEAARFPLGHGPLEAAAQGRDGCARGVRATHAVLRLIPALTVRSPVGAAAPTQRSRVRVGDGLLTAVQVPVGELDTVPAGAVAVQAALPGCSVLKAVLARRGVLGAVPPAVHGVRLPEASRTPDPDWTVGQRSARPVAEKLASC